MVSGCASHINEEGLTQFFAYVSVENQSILCTIGGQNILFDHMFFVETFKLHCEGLNEFKKLTYVDIAEMKVKFYLTRVSIKSSVKNKEMKIEFRLLNDILAKSLISKSGSFDDFTIQRFKLIVAISYGLRSAGPLFSMTYWWPWFLY